MADKPQPDDLELAKKSLSRIQGFDTSTLKQRDRLGTENHFGNAIKPADRLIALYQQLPLSTLELLSLDALRKITQRADADFKLFNDILTFEVEGGSVSSRREQAIANLSNAYDAAFNVLHQWIAYSASRTADFAQLEEQGRAAIQRIDDQAQQITDDLGTTKEQASEILSEIRKIAEEQGVTQQATYFKKAADQHDGEAAKWLKGTIWLAVSLVIYSIASTFVHKIAFLTPTSQYETVQLAVSKVLIFAVLSYMLILAAKNFLSHRHNSVVNRHRQDALTTYKAIVDAAQDDSNRDIVLNHAAACIFEPQPTGYARDDSSSQASSLVGLIGGKLGAGSGE
jgi:membrane protein implicated in regulation of membrane protease activity